MTAGLIVFGGFLGSSHLHSSSVRSSILSNCFVAWHHRRSLRFRATVLEQSLTAAKQHRTAAFYRARSRGLPAPLYQINMYGNVRQDSIMLYWNGLERATAIATRTIKPKTNLNSKLYHFGLQYPERTSAHRWLSSRLRPLVDESFSLIL